MAQDLVFTSQHDLSSVDLAFALAAEHWPEEDPDDTWQQVSEIKLEAGRGGVIRNLSVYQPRNRDQSIQTWDSPSSAFYFLGNRWLQSLQPAHKGSQTCGVDELFFAIPKQGGT